MQVNVRRLNVLFLAIVIVFVTLFCDGLSLSVFAAGGSASSIASNSQVLVLQSDGRLFGWGDNSYGQLGIGSQLMSDGSYGGTKFAIYDPIEITWFKENQPTLHLTDVYCAVGTSYVKTDDGALWACGDNSKGQCGTGETTSVYKTWQKVSGTGTSSFKVGRVWVKYDTVFLENTQSTDKLYVMGSDENSKSGAYSRGNKNAPYSISLKHFGTSSIKDIQMSKSGATLYTTNGYIFYTGYIGMKGTLTGSAGIHTYYYPSEFPKGNSNSKRIGFDNQAENDIVNGFHTPIAMVTDYQLDRDGCWWRPSTCSFFGASYFSSFDICTNFTDKYKNCRYWHRSRGDAGVIFKLASTSGYGLLYTEDSSSELPYRTYDVYVPDSIGLGGSKVPKYEHSDVGDTVRLNNFVQSANLQYTGDRGMYIYLNVPYTFGMTNSKGQHGCTTNGVIYPTPHKSFNSARTNLGDNVTINKLICFDEINYMLLNDAKKSLYSNGSNEFGQLGIDKTAEEKPFSPDAHEITELTGKGVVSIQSDGYSAVALCGNGDIYTWGSNALGTCAVESAVTAVKKPTLLGTFKYIENEPVPSSPTNLQAPDFIYKGDTPTFTWTAPAGVTKFLVETKVNNGVWTSIGDVENKTQVTVDIGTAQTFQLRVASKSDTNLISNYVTTKEYTTKDPPSPPPAVIVNPSYGVPGDTVTIKWGAPAVTGGYVVQRKIDNGSFIDFTTTSETTCTDELDEFWSKVQYRVAWKPDPSSGEQSIWTESKEVIVSQALAPPTLIRCPASANADSEFTITWDEPNIIGLFSYKIYQSINGSEYSAIKVNWDSTSYTVTADKTWKKVQYKVATTNGYEESSAVVGSPITIIGGIDTGGSDDEKDDDKQKDDGSGGVIIPGGGTVIVPMEPEKEGIAVSTSAVISRLKKTSFGKTGMNVDGRFMSYDSVKETLLMGNEPGLVLPVTYKSSKLNMYVSGYLDFGGNRYSVHWGDFDGAKSIKNLSGTVLGYVYVPLNDMTTDTAALECKLYVQDSVSSGEGGTPRIMFSETFTVGVDMSNP